MIALSVETFALARARHRGIFDCMAAGSDWDQKDRSARASHYTAEFPHGCAIVEHVFKDVAAVDQIESLVATRKRGDVKTNIHTTTSQVSRYISPCDPASKARFDATFWRDVKDVQRLLEKTSVTFQI
jgi:hypothetical protein